MPSPLCCRPSTLIRLFKPNFRSCKMGSISKDFRRKPLILSLLVLLSSTLILLIHYLYTNVVQVQIRYPRWYQEIANELQERRITVGLVNLDEGNSKMIKLALRGKAEIVKVHFEPVADHIQWSSLFPKWIDEANPRQDCPEIPMPQFEDYGEAHVVVAKIPCSRMGNRDVFRLQVNLVVANMLVRSRWKENIDFTKSKRKYVVFVGSCGPMWEIFRCDGLVWHQGVWSIYKPDLRRLRQKLLMPVGACKLAPPFAELSAKERWNNSLDQPREAYVTLLHSSEAYVCGAIALAQSIKRSNSTKDLVLLADDYISAKSLEGLVAAGWKIKRIKRIRSPHAQKHAYNEWNYSKLRIWQLTEYDKVMFIDSDLLVLKNLDEFFLYPQISAVWNDGYLFNSGLMIIEPSQCTFQRLMAKRFKMGSYNGGDQGFLNEMFPWWHRWPAQLNFLKFFGNGSDIKHNIPDNLYAIHYLGLKPWMCYQDYDCNWDNRGYQIFASDFAHKKWWKIYEVMPKKLKSFCELTPKMDARIKKWRAEAKNANLPDRHWMIKVRDRRRHL